MSEIMIGTSGYPAADTSLMQQAGTRWVRQGFAFPFADRVGGELTDGYRKNREQARQWAAAGMKIMGITPLPGIETSKPDAQGKLRPQWTDFAPVWAGQLGSDQWLATYELACRFIAEDVRGLVPVWQIANELDIRIFAGPLSPRRGCELVMAGARGLKSADPSLVVGHNPAGADKAYYFFAHLWTHAEKLLDYCGIDGYYGTWAAGDPGSWASRISELHELTGRPVLVNEWGYSSAGGIMSDEERRNGGSVCQLRKWAHGWGKGHTPDGQADFVAGAFEAFRSQRDKLLGVFFYRWEDQKSCWQCGSPECPAEIAWGLVDLHGKPKPALAAFRDGAAKLRVD